MSASNIEQLAELAASGAMDALEKRLLELNETYATTNHHGKETVYYRYRDPAFDVSRAEWIAFEDFRRRYSHERFTVVDKDEKKRSKDIGSLWLSWPGRKRYKIETFLPGIETPSDTLNLWNGLSVTAAPGNYSLIKDHMLRVICSKNTEHFNYLWGWLARLVQKPGEQARTALVLLGPEGIGKSVITVPFLKIFGGHGIRVVQNKHFTGHFNAQLGQKVLVVAEEAFFAGDPSQRGALFALITEDSLIIEPKGFDARPERNFIHAIMCTNEAWAVPAGANSRRFFILNVSDAHCQEAAYFEPLWKQIEDPVAVAGMLHDLLAYDLSNFDPNHVPQTAALVEQKLLDLQNRGGTPAWLYGCLNSGRIAGIAWRETDGVKLPKEDAARAFQEWSCPSDPLRARRELSLWGKVLRDILGSLLKDDRPSGRRHLTFGCLSACRKAFEKWLRAPSLDWDFDPNVGGSGHTFEGSVTPLGRGAHKPRSMRHDPGSESEGGRANDPFL